MSDKWTNGFRAALNECLPHSFQLCVPDDEGVPPLRDPDKNGQLIYPIELDGVSTSALLDHGASTCFVDRGWIDKHNCQTRKLNKPLRLIEFSGSTNVIQRELRVEVVSFAGTQRPWSFLVSPRSPYPVVIGLDLIRSWPLYYNPRNDRILVVSASSPSFICSDSTPPIARHSEQEAPSYVTARNVYTRPVTALEADEEEESIRVRYECLPESISSSIVFSDVNGIPKYSAELGEYGAIMITCYTVTASSEEEQDALRKFIDTLPSDLKKVVDLYPRLFSPPDAASPDREVIHHIQLKPDVVPVRRPPYPLGDEKLKAMKTQVQELSNKGWVVPSSSPWGAPILFVKKKEGELRMCIDFRDLNALTIDDSYPLPRLDLLIHRAGSSQYFSKIDLASGFHQIALSPATRELTAFRLPEPVEGNTH